MSELVTTKDPVAVEEEVQAAYLSMFPKGDPSFVSRVFRWVVDCFAGQYEDYQAIDAQYHDLEHTLQGTLCMARLLRNRHQAGVQPELNQRLFELGLLAILLHDTGYLKKRADAEGTGAKYTVVHVNRSADFAAELLARKGFKANEIKSVQNMIRCTGVDSTLAAISFQSEEERVVGYALGTGDLLGQMAAEDYVDKLPILYAEFAEAVRFTKETEHFIAMFSSASDLMQKTPLFWEKFVKKRLERDFGGLHRFLTEPYPDGRNIYLEQIEANMQRLKGALATSSR